MTSRKEHDMGQFDNGPRRAGGRGACRWAVAIATAALAASAALAERVGISPQGTPTELQRVRSKRWWMEGWGHSMQEVAFMDWMTAETGGSEWMVVMPTHVVHDLYAWWLNTVWESGGPPK